MFNLFTPLLKLFSNEPLERLMYIIIIFGLTLWLIPKDFAFSFNSATGIPWLFQIVVFAFSFVTAISFSRLRSRIQNYYSLLPEQRVLLRLSREEIAVFSDFLETGNLCVNSCVDDPITKRLERKGILFHEADVDDRSYYIITKTYSHFMSRLWSNRTKRFNRRL
ncbi:superinfection exclusion B family protein [Yersinia enterocolitica]|nr:superinfection exclusion B family protein [Yersinia enterocolitica]EKN5999854.1 superinfection exclusion protein B [Yersinia enterocolitica]